MMEQIKQKPKGSTLLDFLREQHARSGIPCAIEKSDPLRFPDVFSARYGGGKNYSIMSSKRLLCCPQCSWLGA